MTPMQKLVSLVATDAATVPLSELDGLGSLV